MAKSVKVRRKDLIQPDQFISTTDIMIAYCAKHKTKLISIAVSLILVVFLGLWIKHNQNKKNLKMESLYFRLEQAKLVEGTNSDDKIKQMELLLDEFSKGPQKQRAFLILADEYFNEGSYDKAIEFYQNVFPVSLKTWAVNRSSSSFNQQLAKIGIAYSLEGKKDYKNAISAYKTVIQYPNEYPLFDIYMGLARCYKLNNEKNEALLILREMQNKFSSNPQIDNINSKIKNLDV